MKIKQDDVINCKQVQSKIWVRIVMLKGYGASAFWPPHPQIYNFLNNCLNRVSERVTNGFFLPYTDKSSYFFLDHFVWNVYFKNKDLQQGANM